MTEVDLDAEARKHVILDIGKQLGGHKSCPNKDLLVKLLRRAENAFRELKQLVYLKPAIKPLSDSLIKHKLLQHKDKEVRLLVAICMCEIIRVLAPSPDFSDSVFRDIFKLFLSMFVELTDTSSPYFSRRVKLLETVAKLEVCVLMLDTGCEDLVLDMFNIFFVVIKEHHPQNLVASILSIMALILKEKVSQPLLDVIMQNLLKEAEGVSPASYRLAITVIQNCSRELEASVCSFLTACILDNDAVRNKHKDSYHELIFEIFQAAPQMLFAVIPNLSQDLLTDQVDIRIKAINLIGKLLALPGNHVAQEYHHLFVEYLNRFSDKSAEIRLAILLRAKAIYTTNTSGTESLELLSAVKDRLLDFDDKVRTQAMMILCDLVRSNSKVVPSELIALAAERLRDKKVSVRKKALQKLLEVYQDYCTKCSGGLMALCEHFEQIPCRILMLCYDKECKEFRPQNLDRVLVEDLFPASLSVDEYITHWTFLFSVFTPLHLKALNIILRQKKRLQTEMQVYLTLRKKEVEDGSEEIKKKIKMSVVTMSTFFPDPAKAEEYFHKMSVTKDRSIFNVLEQLLDEVIIDSQRSKNLFMQKIGDTHPQAGFLQLLFMKLVYNIFSSEHVRCIVNHLSSESFGSKHSVDSSVKLLTTIVSTFPSLLRGSEKQFCLLLLQEKIPMNEDLIQMLAKAGPQLSINPSDIYPLLKRVCLVGTRAQSKLAVSAIATLANSSQHLIFSDLWNTLKDHLLRSQNVPTVLQSLGCIAQVAVSTFQTQDRAITQYIVEEIIQGGLPEYLHSFDETSDCSFSCKLKIYGLKVLVKQFLSRQQVHVNYQINDLLDLLLQLLQNGDSAGGAVACEADKAHMRLAAAKSVLRLSKRWDLHISPQIFRSTVLMVKDSSPIVRRLFINKTNRLLKQHAIPNRYGCAFALAASGSFKDIQDDSLKYIEEFISKNSKFAAQGPVTDWPLYIVAFLIHVLAHDSSFLLEQCQDKESYVQLCSPLVIILKALVSPIYVDGDMDLVKNAVAHLMSIFHAIKKAEDAIDAQITTKLHFLADIGIYTVNLVNHGIVSASYAPTLILLPSSLYRVADKRESKLKFKSLGGLAENIAKEMLNFFEFQPSNAHAKRGRKWHGDSSLLNAMKSSRNESLALCKKVGLPTNEISCRNDSLCGRGKQQDIIQKENEASGSQQLPSSCHPDELIELHRDFSIDDEDEKGASEISEQIFRNEQFSSCDSVTIKPIILDKEDLTSSYLRGHDRIAKCNIIASEHSDFSRAYQTDLSTTKEIRNKGEELIGNRIKIWSPVGECFYSGTVDEFDCTNGTHKITFDSGEIEVVSLENENWEPISDELLLEKDQDASCLLSTYCEHNELSSISNQRKTVDARQYIDLQDQEDMLQKKKINLLDGNIPCAEKRKRKPNMCVDTSESDVISANKNAIGQRTRRRKVLSYS